VSEDSAPEFSPIYDAYHGKVVAYAAKLIGRDDAEDVAQEVFFKVSQSLGTLDDRSRLAPWIFAITLNTVRDLARMRAARIASTRAPPAPAEGEPTDLLSRIPDSSARTPEENAVRHEMVACYLDHVKRLPRDYYEVYVLSEFGDLTNPEIARRLSLSLSTVKIRLHRARARLHANLRRDCQGYRNERGELMGEPRRSRESAD
jgi:RNA polymerase sigma-70 factor (ECF subfamily)